MYIDLTLPLTDANAFQRAKNPVARLGHMGTHMDVMDAQPPTAERFFSRGRLVDVPYTGEAIGVDALREAGDLRAGDFVLLRTGWMQRHWGTDGYFGLHPEVSWDAVAYLLECGVWYIGIDAPGIRRGEEHRRVDEMCAARGTFVVENLADTHLLPQRAFPLYCFPMRLAGVSGAAVRVVAEVGGA
jgi:kynurenine formamidase